MIITDKILDELSDKAKASPRLRLGMDLRNTPEDQSQRMLNALEPGTVMPIHRHKSTSETCVCLRGHFEEFFMMRMETSLILSIWYREVRF